MPTRGEAKGGSALENRIGIGESQPPKVVIEAVTPQIVCGRHPVKRVVGETCEVTAVVYKDGHDMLAARLLIRRPGSRPWRYLPMTYDFNSDRFYGSFRPDTLGRWTFTVEAWTDVFETWRDGLKKKLDAGLDVSLELREGARLIRESAEHAAGLKKSRLLRAAEALEDGDASCADRADIGLDEGLRDVMAEHFDIDTVARYPRELAVWVDRERALFGSWYEMFPRSQSGVPGRHGTFRDAARRLNHIADLGFDVVYLPPIHPIGVTNRKGRNSALAAGPEDPGSPWAIGGSAGGHTAVEPKLGTVEDFERFVRAAEGLGIEVALDYALQCSPDHPWVKEHPDWFTIRPDGSIMYAENPPKKYQDIYPLDFWCEDWRSLWEACRDVLFFWIDHGVRIFRVDNPHTKPFSFWEWVIAEVHRRYPDVIFLSEAFTRPNRMKGLAKLGFTQSYTYFTWRNTAAEIRDYLVELTRTEMAEYLRPNFFANTPDILTEYLQSGGRPAFRVRLLLAATLSPSYGIYSGFELCENKPREPGSEEYLNSEKFEIKVRDWEAPGNLNDDIRTLNRIRRDNPALQRLTNVTFQPSDNDQVVSFRKSAPGNDLLIAINLDPKRTHESYVHVGTEETDDTLKGPFGVEDLLTGERYTWRPGPNYVRLDPHERIGHVMRVIPQEVGGERR